MRHAITLPKKMDTYDTIMRICSFTDKFQVDGGRSIASKYAMLWAVFFKVCKNLLL